MNYVVIKAGGIGLRMYPTEKPKQFLDVMGKPIIVYTLEKFQFSSLIQEICISCLEDWIPYMWELVNKYHLDKVKKIVAGGDTGHLSTRNGIYALKEQCTEEDIVIIHDAVRPEFSEEILKECIDRAKNEGAAVACAICLESMFLSEDGHFVDEPQPNYKIYRAQAPQAYQWKQLVQAYEEADNKKIFDAISTDNLYARLKIPQSIVINGQHNFKITTWEDVKVFEALIRSRE